MKKLYLYDNDTLITLNSAFKEFQTFNIAKNLSKKSLEYYEDCFKYFRRVYRCLTTLQLCKI